MSTMRLSLALLVLLVLAAACGGGGGGRFERDEFGITFEIPSGFQVGEHTTVARTGGAKSVADAGIALDSDNGILVSRYDLNLPVTAQNIGQAKPAIDRLVAGLAGRDADGRRVEYGGLPGFEYVVSVPNPPQAQSRLVFLFDRKTEYEFNCQSTPDKRDQLEEGCRTALESIERAGG